MPMNVVALRTDGVTLIMTQPADAPPARGLETTQSLGAAMRFADQAAIDEYVTARAGTPSQWRAMTLPF